MAKKSKQSKYLVKLVQAKKEDKEWYYDTHNKLIENGWEREDSGNYTLGSTLMTIYKKENDEYEE